MQRLPRPILAATTLLCGLSAVATPLRAEEPVRFNRDIRPILADNCYACHGPDMNQRKSDLRLDVREDAVAYTAIVPGKPDESLLVERVFADDPDTVMPPPDSHKKLTPAQKDLLKRWVAQGAEYEGHWAYIVPVRPQVPAGVSAIDHLIRERLKKDGLQPAPPADRRVLARRLYSDLIGLPPKLEEVEAFVNDASPDAYEKLVEKLLASPHYGERMALGWLDVVRFADTIGYHSDNPRNVWPYRDYVIRAFNDNKPFDVFTIEQLAGDLLPNSTQEQKIASCFNRLLLSTEEGGAQAKDYEARMLTDRVRAVGTVWLGQTLGCCQCHDHKFDPMTARDFYQMGAFFADLQEPIIGAREPGMLVTTDAQQQQLASLQSAAAELQKQFDATPPELAAAQQEWERQTRESLGGREWTVLKLDEIKTDSTQLKTDKNNIAAVARNPQNGVDTYRVTVRTTLKDITGFRLDALPTGKKGGPGRAANGNFVLSEFSVADAAGQPVKLAYASATYAQDGFPAERTIDGTVEKTNGWAVNGRTGQESSIVFELAETVGTGEETTLVFTLAQPYGENHVLGRFRLAATTSPKPIRAGESGLPQEIADILAVEPAERNDQQKAKLTAHFKGVTPLLADLRTRLDAAKKSATDYENTLPRVLVSVAMSTPRTVRILPRGNWMDETGPTVAPALPHYLPQPPTAEGQRLTRLDLAKWVASRENPLTARVFVNRLWKQFFGTGLSKTLDDLGSQGEWPTHLELLDWLAVEFTDHGWNVKHMVRQIVLSETYRQSSAGGEQRAESGEPATSGSQPSALSPQPDPDNRLLARQSRWRLDAELVRDNALSAAGLLVTRIGGRSVFPYQPDGYWENLNFPQRTWPASTGEDQYRRGLYTWWQRSFLHPSLLAFDAPTREECAADRTRSNIPQQALVLLNDPTYVEAARAFATRILKDAGPDTDARLTWAWQQALQRPPRDDERRTLKTLLEEHQTQFAANPQAAESLLKVGQAPPPPDMNPAELAAWTNAARVILNLHETITRN